MIRLICLSMFLFVFPVYGQDHSEAGIHVMDVVRSIVENNPDVQVQERQVEAARGNWRTTVGQFDPQVRFSLTRSRDNTPLSLANQAALGRRAVTSDLISYRLSIDKPFRWGMIVSPGVEMTRDDNLTIQNAPTNNRALINLRVTQPLLQGRGYKATAAQEEASNLEYQATRFDFWQTTARQITGGITAYWNYLAAYRNLDILTEAETRAWTLVTETQELIAADEVPFAEINQLEANLADKTTTRIRGEQTLVETRYQLGQAMGLPFDKIPDLPPPTDMFPSMDISILPDTDQHNAFVALALAIRPDYIAADMRQQAAVRQTGAARQNRLPNLNLTIDVGYATLQEGNQFNQLLSSLTQNRTGFNISATMSYDWPLLNNAAKGRVMSQDALLDQRGIQISDLKRRISSNVMVALSALRNRAIELQYAQNAVRLYQTAIESEREKFRLGMSTLLDVINLEDRLRSARINEVTSQVGYASSLVQLRFELGLLVSPDDEAISVTLQDVTTIPITPE